jgi:hypothetical protein
MDVNNISHQLRNHAAALNVPAGPALPPGAGPGWLARLGGLPQSKVCGAALAGVNRHTLACAVVFLQGSMKTAQDAAQAAAADACNGGAK